MHMQNVGTHPRMFAMRAKKKAYAALSPPHLDSRIAAVIEQLPERAGAVRSPGLLSVDGVQGLVQEEGHREQQRTPPGHVIPVEAGAVARHQQGGKAGPRKADERHEVGRHPHGQQGHRPVPEGGEEVVDVGVGPGLVLVRRDHVEVLLRQNNVFSAPPPPVSLCFAHIGAQ